MNDERDYFNELETLNEYNEMQSDEAAYWDRQQELKAENWDYYPDGEYVPNPYTNTGGPVV